MSQWHSWVHQPLVEDRNRVNVPVLVEGDGGLVSQEVPSIVHRSCLSRRHDGGRSHEMCGPNLNQGVLLLLMAWTHRKCLANEWSLVMQ